MADLEELKRKRDQLTARIQAAEARQRAGQKKEDDRVKVLVGAALLDQLKRRGTIPACDLPGLLTLLDGFLTRPGERLAVLGEDGKGSAALHRVAAPEAPKGTQEATPTPSQPQAPTDTLQAHTGGPGSFPIRPDSGEL